jgi:hypothetical protein
MKSFLEYGSPPHPFKVLLFVFKAITAEGHDHSEETPLTRETQRKRTIDEGLAITIGIIVAISLTITIYYLYPRNLKGISDERWFGLHWDEPTRDPHCTAYNTREYSARLLNTLAVPYAYNWTKACEDIPIVIHGRTMKTTRCDTNKSVSCLIQRHGLKNDDHC